MLKVGINGHVQLATKGQIASGRQYQSPQTSMYTWSIDETYWERGYTLLVDESTPAMPPFLSDLALNIFHSGKALNLLRMCNPKVSVFIICQLHDMKLTFLTVLADFSLIMYVKRNINFFGRSSLVWLCLEKHVVHNFTLECFFSLHFALLSNSTITFLVLTKTVFPS